MQVVPKEGWEGYSYSTPSERVFVTFPVSANELDRAQFPWCARVMIDIKAPNHNGGPTGDESAVLWKMEDELTGALQKAEVACAMVGRLTHGGVREIVFQVQDGKTFRPVVGKWIRANPIYGIDVSEHEGWCFFDETIWPSEENWLWIKDAKVVDRLIEAGADPKKPHAIEFVYVGAEGLLTAVESRLTGRGYSRVSLNDGTLVTAKSLELEIGKIFAESRLHHDLAKEFGVSYDGWGAMVQK